MEGRLMVMGGEGVVSVRALVEEEAVERSFAAHVRPYAVRLGVGTGLLVATACLVQWYIGWGELLVPWKEQQLESLVVAVTLVLASYGARAVRVYDHFRPGTDGHFAACLRLTLFHNVLNNLVPMRLGELSFPALLKRYFGVPLARGVGGLLWFRAMDLHVLLAAAAVALAWGAVPFAVSGALLVGWIAVPRIVFGLRDWLGRSVARWLRGKVRDLAQEALAGMPPNVGTFWRTQLWTVANWGLKLAVFAWLLHTFAGAGLAASLMGALGGEISTVLPVHGLGGAGTYEAGVVTGLAPFGLEVRAALAAAVNLHLFLLGTSIVGGFLGLALKKPRAP